MELDTNPYASPTFDSKAERALLPVLLVPSVVSYLIAGSLGFLFLCISLFSIASIMSPLALFTGPFSILGTIATFGCVAVFWSKVQVTEDLIEVRGTWQRTIRFAEVVHWQQHPITEKITLTAAHQRTELDGWAMTRTNCRFLAEVLAVKVGPPKD